MRNTWEHPWVPEELREIIDLLYEDMDKESPEPLFSVWLNEERKAYRFGQFIITGRADEPLGDLFEYVRDLEKTNPKVLLDQLRQLKDIPSSGIRVEEPIEAARIFASLLLLVIREYGLAFPNQVSLIQYLTNVKENRTFGDAARLRLLLHECMLENMDAFTRTMDGTGFETVGKRASHPYCFSRYLSVQFQKNGIIGGIIYRGDSRFAFTCRGGNPLVSSQ